jgi:hypothetical protein
MLQDPGLEELRSTVHLEVHDAVAHAFHQRVMADIVEAGLNVAFDYPLVRRLCR